VARVNQAADANPKALRISIDSKAAVVVGDFSRGGQSRVSVKALDHDMQSKEKLIPFGILAPKTGALAIQFGISHKTSDFVADCLTAWCAGNPELLSEADELVIDCDNGPESNGRRTQFLKRVVELADLTGKRIHLVYYPPYHSKYNPIERCWATLEHHWRGTLLSTAEKAIHWAKTMTWKGLHPTVTFCEKVYEKGVRLTRQAMRDIEARLFRHPQLPNWDIVIEPIRRV
jgi:hypothetical protein